MTDHPAVRRARETGVVAIVRGADPDAAVDVVSALVAGGVRAVEVIADTPGIEDVLADVVASVPPDVSAGAGTVLDSETAGAVVRAGASFVVTPTFDRETLSVCSRHGVPVIAGVATPTEAMAAREAEAAMVKLFPAATAGPATVRSFLAALPDVPVVPTGGVGLGNASEYLAAGATALGVGSALVPDDALGAGDYDRVRRNAERLLATVADARDTD